MPGMSGVEVLHSLRAAAVANGSGCLFYLYSSDAALAGQALAAEFDGLLTFKGDDEALVRQVEAGCRRSRTRARKRHGPASRR